MFPWTKSNWAWDIIHPTPPSTFTQTVQELTDAQIQVWEELPQDSSEACCWECTRLSHDEMHTTEMTQNGHFQCDFEHDFGFHWR